MIKGNEGEVLHALRAAEPWKKGNLKVRRLIIDAIPEEKTELFEDFKTAKEVWDALAVEYRPINRLQGSTLFWQLIGFACRDDMDPTKWVDQIRTIFGKLKKQNLKTLSDADFTRYIISMLPLTDPWKAFTSRMEKECKTADATGTSLKSAYIV